MTTSFVSERDHFNEVDPLAIYGFSRPRAFVRRILSRSHAIVLLSALSSSHDSGLATLYMYHDVQQPVTLRFQLLPHLLFAIEDVWRRSKNALFGHFPAAKSDEKQKLGGSAELRTAGKGPETLRSLVFEISCKHTHTRRRLILRMFCLQF